MITSNPSRIASSLLGVFANIIALVAYALVIWAGRTYAIAKGRDGAWALLGVPFLPLLLVLLFLRDKRNSA